MKISDLRKVLSVDDSLILGHGTSADMYKGARPDRFVIGCNDHSLHFGWDPDVLVIIDSIARFPPLEAEDVRRTGASYLVSQLLPHELPAVHCPVVSFSICGRSDYRLLKDPDELSISLTSPYISAQVAYWLGARRIEVAGIDMFGHKLERLSRRISGDFRSLRHAASLQGVEVDCSACAFGGYPLEPLI